MQEKQKKIVNKLFKGNIFKAFQSLLFFFHFTLKTCYTTAVMPLAKVLHVGQTETHGREVLRLCLRRGGRTTGGLKSPTADLNFGC